MNAVRRREQRQELLLLTRALPTRSVTEQLMAESITEQVAEAVTEQVAESGTEKVAVTESVAEEAAKTIA